MKIQFREFDPFNVWIWVEFSNNPSEMEKQYVEEAFSSWFYLGKLGAFNAENLQVQDVGLEISYMDYDEDQADNSMVALMHNMGEFEFESNWGRCWFDLGTSDAIALDILINTLRELGRDFLTIEQLIIGGENEDWRVPGSNQPDFIGDNERN
ncbi:DUF3531 domain-containing protein [Phormidesmis priestleyi ULC007]|uniref:DUF3531 domain-containing protein n=1 Tax=Phormidesmis priestleyi ULC007 TaxID=1920490 RepID=A0A2T1DEK3_9CYAN|nr:DUF3531 family protein [Phormidesmis priestleyi]PSB18883.1 DUF3531 domain-containing protein [Phormidesmis priestleyi ULC007]PZO50979.1 MAG: DUF3531 domain-containing protein [Phormidesmis priestleyi]